MSHYTVLSVFLHFIAAIFTLPIFIFNVRLLEFWSLLALKILKASMVVGSSILFSFIHVDVVCCRARDDPALADNELQKRLIENRKIGKKRLDEVCLAFSLCHLEILQT